ncbi:MAG: hypothetical protein MUP70_12425, partial [Candidatus Aminicenantes bacterium]|nr:hypothetical protein [Candidatus Aminicenantes bacterium]
SLLLKIFPKTKKFPRFCQLFPKEIPSIPLPPKKMKTPGPSSSGETQSTFKEEDIFLGFHYNHLDYRRYSFRRLFDTAYP